MQTGNWVHPNSSGEAKGNMAGWGGLHEGAVHFSARTTFWSRAVTVEPAVGVCRGCRAGWNQFGPAGGRC